MSKSRMVAHATKGVVLVLIALSRPSVIAADDESRSVDVGNAAAKSVYLLVDRDKRFPVTYKAKQIDYDNQPKRTLTPEQIALRGFDGYLKGVIRIPPRKSLYISGYHTGESDTKAWTPEPIDLEPLRAFNEGDLYGFATYPYPLLVNETALGTLCRFHGMRCLEIMPTKGVRCIAPLRKLKQLDHLSVLEVEADDFLEARDAIAIITSCTELRSLGFAGSKVNDEALEAFRKLKKLEALNVDWNKEQITVRGFRAIAEMTSLREIELGPKFDVSVTDEAILAFRNLPNLERLRVGPVPHVSDQAINALRQKFPDADIQVYNRPLPPIHVPE
jgi:hypothetical protein